MVMSVGRELEIIGQRDFEAVVAVVAQVGHQQAAAAIVADRMGKARHRDQRQAEQFDAGVGIFDARLDRIIDDLDRLDLPGGFLGATLAVFHHAAGIGGLVQRIDAISAFAIGGGQPSARLQHQQHILDHAVLKAVGNVESIAIGDIAFGIGDGDIALRLHFAAGAVPHHRVGAQAIALAQQLDVAGGGHDLAIAVIGQGIGGEADLLVRRRHRGVGGADRRLRLVELLRGHMRRDRQTWKGDPGDEGLFETPGRRTRGVRRMGQSQGSLLDGALCFCAYRIALPAPQSFLPENRSTALPDGISRTI